MKNNILEFLRKSDKYVSGEYISNELNISRAAVWKYIDRLRHEGYIIESSSKKGYRLVEEADILNYEGIQQYLNTKYIGRKIKYFETVPSTNDVIRGEADNGEKEGIVAIAENQTNGRGRMGREWHSNKGSSISMSILLRPDISPNMAPSITSVFALSVVQALIELTGFNIGIKWPNDIILDNKKLCGILTEMNAEIDIINYIIIGVGINVNQESFDKDIEDIAISLRSYSKNIFNRKMVAAYIFNKFEKNYELYETYGIGYFIKDIKEHSVLLGNKVIVKTLYTSYEGTAYDIDMDGCLLIKLEDGRIEKVLSGDISIRGINGYV